MKLNFVTLALGCFLAVGLPFAAIGGPAPGGPNSDADSVEDAFDNCTLVANQDQADADHDGCGDACDLPGGSAEIACDLNGDGAVGIPDFTDLSNDFGCTGGCVGDCTGDGATGIPDFTLLSNQFGNQIGPSGISTANRDPVECPGGP